MSKAAMKRGRTSEGNYASENIDKVLRSTGKKQNLIFEFHVCTIYRITMLPNENFTEPKALAYVDKHYRKRQAHCQGRLLEDRLTFERAKSSGRLPFRPWVGYKEIVHVYRSSSKPLYFVLCVDSQKSMKKYYEIYKCKSPETTGQALERIQRAMNDPDKLLRDPNVLRQVSVAQEDRIRSIPNFEVEESRPASTIEIVSPTPNAYRTPSPDYVRSPVIIAPKETTYVLTAPSPRPPSPKLNFKPEIIDPKSDLTYIAYDSKGQPYAAEKGPIYMFLSRRMVQQDGLPNTERRTENIVYTSPILHNGSY